MEHLIKHENTHGHLVEVAGIDLAFRPVAVGDRTPTGRQILAICSYAPHTDYVVLQWLPGGEIEEIRPEEQINTSGKAAPRLIIAAADRTFRLVLNDRSLEWPEPTISETALRTLGGIDPSQEIYLTREDEADRHMRPGTEADLRQGGTEVFYAKAGEWKLNVQGVVIKSGVPEIRVRDALIRAGFDTEAAWIIVLKTSEGRRQVSMDDVVDLRLPGIEKLRLTPREINNGEVPMQMRRDFVLLASDEAGLAERGIMWSSALDAGRRWLILRDMPLPLGFDVTMATVAMEIPPTYPMAEIDMFYCAPELRLTSGRVIPQTQVTEMVCGRPFQRWSRHRGAIAPWRPNKDSILTHLLLIDASLAREVEQ